MSTSEASKKGKKPTPVGPLKGSGGSDPDNKNGSSSQLLEKHNASGDHKTDDKSSEGSKNNKKQTSVGPPGDSGGSHSVDNKGSSSSSEKHDGSGSRDDKGQIPAAKESKDRNVECKKKQAAADLQKVKGRQITRLPPSPTDARENLEIHVVQRNDQPPAANPQDSCGEVKEPPVLPCGPWGGPGGKKWDDKPSSGIKGIWLKITPHVGIAAIQIGYADGQNVNWKAIHGKDESEYEVSDEAKNIWLEPKEKLTRISGSFGPIISEDDDNGKIIIKSLTFHTNNPDKPHGPYACDPPDEEVAENSSFDSKDQGEVVGFNGRSCGKYLHAIGVHKKKSVMEKPVLGKIFKDFSNLCNIAHDKNPKVEGKYKY